MKNQPSRHRIISKTSSSQQSATPQAIINAYRSKTREGQSPKRIPRKDPTIPTHSKEKQPGHAGGN
jgi:hypothetical protein